MILMPCSSALKRMFALILLFGGVSLFSASQTADAVYSFEGYLNCAREPRILEAFRLMAGSGGESALSIIVSRPIRVIFKDLSTLDKRVANYDALSYMTGNGQLMIYINQKHIGSPPAAIAAILSHEAMHNDLSNSMNEEIAGWTQEARMWRELKMKDPILMTIPKGKYPLVDRLNTLESHLNAGTLVSFVKGQPAYQGLPEHSPGFEDETLSLKPTE